MIRSHSASRKTALLTNRTVQAAILALALLLVSPAAALAAHLAGQAPKAGDVAVSANLGFVHAFDGNFDGFEPVLTGSFEYYSTARTSWRGLLGLTSFDADSPPSADIDFKFLNANFIYNWERGWTHPYVTGGVGLYLKDAPSSLPPDADDTELGVNVGGGVDLFLGARWALKLEGTLHSLAGAEPDTFVLGTAGVEWWF